MKTPQKTPKSILKQPGSECKRRRVLLISPEKENLVTHSTNHTADEATKDTNPESISDRCDMNESGNVELIDSDSDTHSHTLDCVPPPPRTPSARNTPQPRVRSMETFPTGLLGEQKKHVGW